MPEQTSQQAGPSQPAPAIQQNIAVISDQERAALLENPQPEMSGARTSGEPTLSQRTSAAFTSLFRGLWRSPAPSTTEASASGTGPSGSSNSTIPVVPERSSSRGALDVEHASEIEGASLAPRATPSSSSSTPVCLICLENLAADDFASGRAISLGCQCRGDLALRHRECAVKWAQVKDDGRGGVPVCELCKHPVRNLPPLPPRPRLHPDPDTGLPTAAAMADVYSDPSSYSTFAPSTADLVFDCIRVTWVAMIVSILFFEASLGSALWTGVVAGVAYSLMVRIMYRQHFEAMRAYAEQHAAARQQLDPSGGQVPVHMV